MMFPPGFTWFERWMVEQLIRSPRISLVVIKGFKASGVLISADRRDPEAMDFIEDDDEEPPAMLLERIYHAPSHGEE